MGADRTKAGRHGTVMDEFRVALEKRLVSRDPVKRATASYQLHLAAYRRLGTPSDDHATRWLRSQLRHVRGTISR